MPRRLVKDRAAETDLIHIWVYTSQTWGESQADKYFDSLEAGISEIRRNPEAGRSRESLRQGYWSKTIEHHVVFYTFNEHEVRVRRVLHEVMDFGEHLPRA